MKKISVIIMCFLGFVVFANPPLRHNNPLHGHRPQTPHINPPHHNHHESHWGKGGENFWPGFVSGIILGTTVKPVPPPPPPTTIVVNPTPIVVQPKQVWVEGHYEYQIVNGISTRVWIPGKFVIIQ